MVIRHIIAISFVLDNNQQQARNRSCDCRGIAERRTIKQSGFGGVGGVDVGAMLATAAQAGRAGHH